MEGRGEKTTNEEISMKLKQFYFINLATVEKVVMTMVLTLWWLFGPVVGYGDILEGGPAGNPTGTIVEIVMPHVLYMVSHASFWHLLGNVFVLWMVNGRLFLWRALAIAFLCSWLPGVGSIWEIVNNEPVALTVGFSGVLFAIFGIKWGHYCVGQHKGKISRKGRVLDEQRTALSEKRLKRFCTHVLPFAVIGFFVPHLNWTIHLYCLTAGFFVGMLDGYNTKWIKA